MLFNMNNLESYNSARREVLKITNFLVWTGIRRAIPPELRTLVSLEFQSGETVFTREKFTYLDLRFLTIIAVLFRQKKEAYLEFP